MCAYAKTAPGERLTYRPFDLSRYEGERFCLRITPEDIDLERCFFVYLDEMLEGDSIRRLFQNYFFAPKPGAVDTLPFGFDAVKPALELMSSYALEMKIIPRRYSVEELFDDTTRALQG